jgi:hypothetical protein
MKTVTLLMAFALLAFTAACISDDNRCGPGQFYITDVEEGGKYYCYDPNDELDAGPETDAGEPGEDGIGETCTYGGNECANFEADFCHSAQEEGAEGYCTYQDCIVDGSDCPSGYTCCNFRYVADLKYCMTDADYQGSGLCL